MLSNPGQPRQPNRPAPCQTSLRRRSPNPEPMGKPAALMVQGTGSDVGKSLIVAGLCRVFTRQGLRVRPFKPQNMSNNAAVTADGGEIGRAQALQARACGVAPQVDMNPVLLKPQTDRGAQLVVRGRVRGTAEARAYQTLKATLLPEVLESYARLGTEADLILVEGAGSPAEVNLRRGDIANMGFAEAANLPVVLVGDIDRGGVIASLVGTWMLLPAAERHRLKGYLINKFRGDPSLFDDGLAIITEHTGRPALGVIPHFPAAGRLPAEDAMALTNRTPDRTGGTQRPIVIVVPQLSRIANFDDLDPLRLEPDVSVILVPPGRPLPADADLVILPGSKSTIGDLQFVKDQGWDVDLVAHHRRGGRILGLCGGYQMLGTQLSDPAGVEGPVGTVAGLGLLAVETVLAGDKRLTEVRGTHLETGTPVAGYEMHIGKTDGPDRLRPMLRLSDRSELPRGEGAVSPNGLVAGTYVHGLFTQDRFRHAFLDSLQPRTGSGLAFEATIEETLDELADHLTRHCAIDQIAAIAGL